MSRPRKYDERRATAIRFDKELHDRLVVAASERQVSLNLLVNRAVAEFLDNLLPVEEVRWTRARPKGPRGPMPPPAPPTPETHEWNPLLDAYIPRDVQKLVDP